MREILFRGKRKDTGEWIYGSLQCFKGYSIFDTDFKNFVAVESKTIGQFTGLLDKNGTKIFEGDIVKDSGYILTKDNRVVEWVGESCGFEPFSDSLENCGHCGGGMMPDWTIVIGNIHDNPELIKA